MECLNCGTEFDSNFCPHCGQKKSVKRYSLNNLVFSDLPKAILNTDKGFLHNIKYLTITPKQFINDYLAGKRKNAFKPIQFVFLTITVLTLIDEQFARSLDSIELSKVENTELYQGGYFYGKFLRTNIQYLWLSMLILFALGNRLFYNQYNLAEHMIINAFVMGQAAFYTILCYPVFSIRFLINPIHLLGLWLLFAIVYRTKRDGLIYALLISGVVIFLSYLAFLILPYSVIYFFGLMP
ncbi:MAG: DUF3667 domain-containing protein [Saprospiraceae bacterium]|nr:DUF3667 domain-containing protein [Saprospiraceae bacterium]